MRAIMLLLAASHLACSNAAPEGSVAPQASGSVADDTATAQLTAAPPTTTTTGSAAPSPKPEPVATAGASIALQPAVGSVNRGASIAL